MDCCWGIFCGEGGSDGFPFRSHCHVCSKGIESDDSNLADPLEGSGHFFLKSVCGWRDCGGSYKKGQRAEVKRTESMLERVSL